MIVNLAESLPAHRRLTVCVGVDVDRFIKIWDALISAMSYLSPQFRHHACQQGKRKMPANAARCIWVGIALTTGGTVWGQQTTAFERKANAESLQSEVSGRIADCRTRYKDPSESPNNSRELRAQL